ncbi:MAG: hypothetical protein KAU58_01435 [Candidatus Omnitrophica bacterium]|nr:hypothetical protein [Candidatus Omnitrophota bacterium]
MAALVQINNMLDLAAIIQDKFYTYYPEFAEEHIDVKGTLLRKWHRSDIYRFDVHNTKDILKSLIVKQRIHNKFYNNHIVENTQHEYTILKELNNTPNFSVSVPKVLDSIPEKALLITEKVEGESLYSYLKRISYLPITESRKAHIKQMFAKIGKWLREFHDISFEGKKEKINTQEFIKKAEEIVEKFPSIGIPIDQGKALIDKMKSLEKETASYTFPVVLKHGDFQPMNIIFQGDNLIVLDISAKTKDIAIKDVCNFITGSSTFDVKLLYSFCSKEIMDDSTNVFITAYFTGEKTPNVAVEFVKILGILESLNSVYSRNTSNFKRRIITHYYINKIKRFRSNR